MGKKKQPLHHIAIEQDDNGWTVTAEGRALPKVFDTVEATIEFVEVLMRGEY